jgi:hypothetical protein
MGAEHDRVLTFGHLEEGLRDASPWYLWGPYLSERQWGTVREDYSANGTAWEYLPHDHARSRAYRWGEDGLAGFSDIEQRMCVGLALWNGRDPVLKERIFGLTGNEGNHGEDAKEYWWYLDATPSHAWNRLRYHYPQREFPYTELVAENARRGRLDPEYELLDTGVFDEDRYWIVDVDYAKADPYDLLMTVTVTNAGPETATLQVLPTVWYRNTWAWDTDGADRPFFRRELGDRLATVHPFLGPLEIVAQGDPRLLFCDNETNADRLYGSASTTTTPKDGINDHVVAGADTVAYEKGTKAAFWYSLEVPQGERKRFASGCAHSARPRIGGATSTRSARSGTPRQTSSTQRRHPQARRKTRRWSCGRRSPACSGRSRRTCTTSRAGSMGIPHSPRRRRSAVTDETRVGAVSSRSTSSRCPTSGSTRGSRPGISRSTASRSLVSILHSQSTS